MSLKTNILALMLIALSATAQAREIRSVWKSMPDSVVLAIDKVRQLEMLDLVDYKVKAEVNNRLGSHSVMDTITANYLHIMVTKASELSMRLLPTAECDTLVCMVYTYKAPKPESKISFYSLDWQLLDASKYLPFTSIADAADSLYTKPDSISQERYAELRNDVVVALVSAQQSIENDDICLSLSLPMAAKDNKASMTAIADKRKLVWTGKKYVYSSSR